MPLLIDGNNLLGFADMTESRLIEQLSVLSQRKSLRIVVCFDGAREHGQTRQEKQKLTLLYSGHYRSADDLIVDQASHLRDTKNWVVHTNDRALAAEVREYHVQVQKVEPLLAQLRALEASEANKVAEKPAWEGDVEGLMRGMLKKKS